MWDKKRVKLGYHWYHLDGSEMLWDGVTTPLPSNVMPGLPLVMTAKVTTPKYDGQYVLVWDMLIDGVWQSTQPLTRGGCTLPVFVEVSGGRLVLRRPRALSMTPAHPAPIRTRPWAISTARDRVSPPS